jgi:hypothetical protein
LEHLRDRRKKIAEWCRKEHQSLKVEIDAFYTRNPQLEPIPKPKPSRSDVDFQCVDTRFENCSKTVYDYPNNDRKTIKWERAPRAAKKSKGMNDGYGCGCRI